MDKVSQLLAGAFELFYRESVHGVGINQILAEAGIARRPFIIISRGRRPWCWRGALSRSAVS